MSARVPGLGCRVLGRVGWSVEEWVSVLGCQALVQGSVAGVSQVKSPRAAVAVVPVVVAQVVSTGLSMRARGTPLTPQAVTVMGAGAVPARTRRGRVVLGAAVSKGPGAALERLARAWPRPRPVADPAHVRTRRSPRMLHLLVVPACRPCPSPAVLSGARRHGVDQLLQTGRPAPFILVRERPEPSPIAHRYRGPARSRSHPPSSGRG